MLSFKNEFGAYHDKRGQSKDVLDFDYIVYPRTNDDILCNCEGSVKTNRQQCYFLFITGCVHNDSTSCPQKEEKFTGKLKMDTAFLNITSTLKHPITVSGISSDCYKVHITQFITEMLPSAYVESEHLFVFTTTTPSPILDPRLPQNSLISPSFWARTVQIEPPLPTKNSLFQPKIGPFDLSKRLVERWLIRKIAPRNRNINLKHTQIRFEGKCISALAAPLFSLWRTRILALCTSHMPFFRVLIGLLCSVYVYVHVIGSNNYLTVNYNTQF